ncbi:hypothetical protein BFR40_07390 [Brochothrix thermosphacta]|uniref:BppU family phage baseplate upper protein n=1 Tax=Brochothrix thermosphacta TaxID=2756 RepID=UPI00083FCF8B|nr:BppU family phage baseplate upper protein [Brochothrix thermosphacta]ODJ51811.1 hypothetical protein BFR40_07390 [Brochothrix thermosphacta]
MSITKIAKMTTEITADYQKLSDLNVAFYNQDVNTSILQFDVTRNNAPVPLGKVNVDGYIVLLAADGSRIQDAVEITDEINGVIEYTIPREFLKHTGKSLGQIYIAVKGKDDTAVMRQFSFDIKDDLLTSFSATKKLEYIKTFDDLTTFIKQRVDEIDAAIANGADYVAAMEKASEKGQKDIQAVATKATTDVNKAATDATKNIADTSNTAVATVNAKGDAVLKAFTENGQVPKITSDSGAPRYDLNSTKDLFAEILTWGNGFFTFYLSAGATNNPTGTVSWLRGTASTYGKNSNVLAYDKDGAMYTAVCANGVWLTWGKAQMYKTTEDDGSSLTLSGYDLLNTSDISNFDGYVTTATNSPTNLNNGYFKRKYRSGYIEVTYSPYNSNAVYRNAYHFGNKVWYGWEKIISQSDTVTYQKQKITNDDGSTIVIANYDLLNTTDVTNFDGYSNTAINMPIGISQAGYIKRKYRGGLIEVTYSPYNSNAVYRNSYNSVSGGSWIGWEKLVTASELAASKPVVLWSGSANGVSSTPYALSRAINTSRKIRVTYDFPGASGKTAVVDLSNTKILIIHDFNLTDSDANGGGLYEFQLDFTALNKFTIKADTVKDLNGAGKIDQKNITVRKIEEAD